MSDIFSLKVEELTSKIKDAQLTSVEICEAYLERIKKFEKDVKAWAHFDKKLLLEKAAESDEHRRSGKPLGPLHGIPIALKDIIGTVDMPTECGTVIRKGKSFSQNAEIVDLLLSAGAIVMGKTATSELAFLGPPKTTNPHDHTRTPGGSSSGSAASVASFMAPLSIGSQTGGSVIRPASYCGVVGYKPSYGLISRNGVLKTSDKLDHIGIFGRSVEDVALLAKVLIKKDSYDSATIHYSTENMLNETKKMIILPPGGDLGLHEDVGLVAPGGGGAPASHNGRHRVIVGGGVGQTGGHHGAAEAEGGGQLEQREVRLQLERHARVAPLDRDLLPAPHRRVHLADGAAGEGRARELVKVAFEGGTERELHLGLRHLERVHGGGGMPRREAVAELARQQVGTRGLHPQQLRSPWLRWRVAGM